MICLTSCGYRQVCIHPHPCLQMLPTSTARGLKPRETLPSCWRCVFRPAFWDEWYDTFGDPYLFGWQLKHGRLTPEPFFMGLHFVFCIYVHQYSYVVSCVNNTGHTDIEFEFFDWWNGETYPPTPADSKGERAREEGTRDGTGGSRNEGQRQACTYPSLPSLPCCSGPAKATCLEGLKVQKLLFGASFLSVQKVTLGILG